MHSSTTRQRSPTRAPARGVASVELALLLPILMLVLFGTIEYGWMFLKNQQLADAARSGARVAVTAGATNALARARVDEVMTTAGLAASGYQVTFTPGDISSAVPGTAVRVEVLVSYANIGLTGIPLIPVPSALEGQTSMIKEGTP